MESASPRPKYLPLTASAIGITAVLVAIAGYWCNQVARTVPDPYLDEVFHIRQALAYWTNSWGVWDPKITTPPGLYVMSYIWLWLLAFFHVNADIITQLRILNLVEGAVVLCLVSRQLLYSVTRREYVSHKESEDGNGAPLRLTPSFALNHAALNICLFPPLFFFYALFYSDVISAMVVLHVYMDFHQHRNAKVFIGSMIALTFRQTNIFWTAVYLGGFEVLRHLERGRVGEEFPVRFTVADMVKESWRHACLYDPFVGEARFEDYLMTILSVGTATLASLQTLLRPMLPYLIQLFAFGIFVLRNGGVVLGDKENHVVSLHPSQMLYIWPYITFFSFPILCPYILNAALPQSSIPAPLRTGSTRHLLPRLKITIPILAAMLLTVHYNTLVHPFTLADNRHYTFYVFRLLRCHPAIKYLAIPIYYICAWAAIVALSGYPNSQNTQSGSNQNLQVEHSSTKISKTQRNPSLPMSGNRTSFLIIFLLATSLSLITAPLVEPRYFIIPWLIWRLHIPAQSPPPPSYSSPRIPDRSWLETSKGILDKDYDSRLWFETAWFLLVNAGTGYIFLNWGFAWPQEEGLVQRFMW